MTISARKIGLRVKVRRHRWLAEMVLVCGTLISGEALASTVTFETLTTPSSIPAAGFFNGGPGTVVAGESVSTPIVAGNALFSNTFGIEKYGEVDYPYWFGFALSNVVNSSDNSFTNQYAAYPSTGSGAGYGSSTNYAVAYGNSAVLTLPSAGTVDGFQIANTTYSYLSMRDGDEYGFSSPLASNGWFRVTASGSLAGSTTGSAEFYLADLRTGSSPGLLANWAWFDLSGLGTVDSVSFAFTGSDSGAYGLNTPAYFAMDQLTYVPEPTTIMLLGCGGTAAGLVLLRRRQRRGSGRG